jgi:hypothetical protein
VANRDAPVQVDFDWYVCTEGYRLVEMQPRRAFKGAEGPLLMLCQPEGPAPKEQRYVPLDQYPALFRTFADTPTSPEGVLQFANRFGMLGGEVAVQTDRELPSTPTSLQRFVVAEPVVAWLNAILRMRQAVALWDMVSAGDLAGLEQVIIQNLDGLHFHPKPEWFLTDWRRQTAQELRTGMQDFGGTKLEAAKPVWFWPSWLDRDGRFERRQGSGLVSAARLLIMQFVTERLDAKVWLEGEGLVENRFYLAHRPQSLVGAIWLQFAHALAAGRRYRTCNECGEWFEIPLRGARISREYCTNACRSKAYRRRQDRARALAAEGKAPKDIARELDTTASVVRKWLKTGKGD